MWLAPSALSITQFAMYFMASIKRSCHWQRNGYTKFA
jgi:hypothetical protein